MNNSPEAGQPGPESYTIEQVLAVFSRAEILDVNMYYLEHVGNLQTLLGQPLPPDFAPDRADQHHLLTNNHLSDRTAEASHPTEEDVVANALRDEIANHPESQPDAERALRVWSIAAACVAQFAREAKEDRIIEEE